MPEITPAGMKESILSNLESTAAKREKMARDDIVRQHDYLEVAEDLRTLHSQLKVIPDGDPRFAELASIVNQIIAKRTAWTDEGFYDDIGYKYHPQSAKMLLQAASAHFQRIARRSVEEPKEESGGFWPVL